MQCCHTSARRLDGYECASGIEVNANFYLIVFMCTHIETSRILLCKDLGEVMAFT